jgi:flagellar hook-basal body complex protein FliE
MAIIGPAERLNQILANQKQLQGGPDSVGSDRITGQGFVKPEGPSFGDTFKSMVNSVNDMQVESKDLATRFIAGEVDDVHDAMVSMEKASLSFQFMVEVRNRLVEGYQEIMRMQV